MVIGTRLKAHNVHKHRVPAVALLAMFITVVLCVSGNGCCCCGGGSGGGAAMIAHMVQLLWSRSGCWT
jgi:hypothetical protein